MNKIHTHQKQYAFGKKSRERLDTCHPDLQKILKHAMNQQEMDFSVLEGHRGKQKQNEMVAKGTSLLAYPRSKHNKMPSLAVDVAPYPIDWQDTKRFKALAILIKKSAKALGVSIAWGGDWKTLVDMPHFELV